MEINRYEELAKEIFLASLEVYKIMGSGLLESVYEMCLLRELQLRNISAECQVVKTAAYIPSSKNTTPA